MANAAHTKDTFIQLLEVLNRVKLVLTNGDFGALRKITDRQNRLFADLEGHHLISPLTPQQIRTLGQLAGQNQRYLTAAKAGIRAANQRKYEVRHLVNPSQTYDRKGKRARLEILPDQFEKRS
jgi:hypothetical protein